MLLEHCWVAIDPAERFGLFVLAGLGKAGKQEVLLDGVPRKLGDPLDEVLAVLPVGLDVVAVLVSPPCRKLWQGAAICAQYKLAK